jgi:hypothetical protein
VADWRGLLDALSYTGPGAINSLARNTANSLMSGEDPAYRYQMLPFTEDAQGNTSFGIPQMGMDVLHSLNRTLDQAQGRLDEDGRPITTRGLDAINVAGIAPLGGIAAGGGKALAAGLAANRAEAAAPLAMDQASRLSRARDMGFDTDNVMYHGTGSPSIDAFDVSKAGTVQKSDWGEGVYFSPSRGDADYYRTEALKKTNPDYLAAWDKYEALSANPTVINGSPKYSQESQAALKEFQDIGRKLNSSDGGQVVESYLKLQNPFVSPYQSMPDPFMAEYAKSRGHDGIKMLNGDGSLNEVVVFDPRNIRSVNATFDPSKSDSANLLAANSEKAAAPLALNALEGQPIRAYRGMQMDRQQGAKSDTMFGSSDPEVAASYANQVEDPRFGSSFESGAMMPLDMNFNNPMRVDAGGNYWSEIPYNGDFASTDQLVSKARALGHDGLIVDNVKDALTRGSEPATTYAAIGRGTVRSPLTGETLFSNPDEAVPLSLGLNALDQQAPDQIDINELLRRYGIPP